MLGVTPLMSTTRRDNFFFFFSFFTFLLPNCQDFNEMYGYLPTHWQWQNDNIPFGKNKYYRIQNDTGSRFVPATAFHKCRWIMLEVCDNDEMEWSVTNCHFCVDIESVALNSFSEAFIKQWGDRSGLTSLIGGASDFHVRSISNTGAWCFLLSCYLINVYIFKWIMWHVSDERVGCRIYFIFILWVLFFRLHHANSIYFCHNNFLLTL